MERKLASWTAPTPGVLPPPQAGPQTSAWRGGVGAAVTSLVLVLVVVLVRTGRGTHFGQGSHNIYITIGPEF